jgi:hypothetical protein
MVDDSRTWIVRFDWQSVDLPEDLVAKMTEIRVSLTGPDGVEYERSRNGGVSHTGGAQAQFIFTEPEGA